MNQGRAIFAQLMDGIHREESRRCVRRYYQARAFFVIKAKKSLRFTRSFSRDREEIMSYEDIFKKSRGSGRKQARGTQGKEARKSSGVGRPKGSSLLGKTEQCAVRLPVGMLQRLDEEVVRLRALFPEHRGQIKRNALVATALELALEDKNQLTERFQEILED